MPPSPYAAGTEINGRYELLRLLGQGADGEVHAAHDSHLKSDVALKIMRPKNGEPVEWTEAQLLERLQGDYLLSVSNADIVHGSDIRFIATPIMAGGDLADAAAPVGVDTETATRWGVQMAHATDRLHASRLLHRDIKPGNTYLDSNQDCQLADLGKAVALASDDTAPPDGSFITVAPEALSPSSAHCTVRSDVYSLGASVFYLLTGEYPISQSGVPPAKYRDMIVAGSRRKVRDLAPHVMPGLGRCVETALNTDPSSRFGTALDFANSLARASHYKRCWRLADHPGHLLCLSAQAQRGAAALDICSTDDGPDRANVEVAYPGGSHLRRHEQSNVKRSRLPTVVREICRVIG